MRVCALILAHQKPQLLTRLVRTLSAGGVDCYVHLDPRQDPEPFRSIASSQTTFVHDPQPIFWGGFSMIEAAFRLVDAARNQGSYTHYLHISGDTYPIRAMRDVVSLLTLPCDWIDVGVISEADPTFDRIRETYLPDCALGNLSTRDWYGYRRVDQKFLDSADTVKRVYAMKKSASLPIAYAKGSNWWCLRHETLQVCRSVYETERDLTDWFRYSAHPDESFFNSVVKDRVIDGERRGTPLLTTWDRQPKPYEYGNLADLALLRASNQPLARKFLENSCELLDALEADF